MLNIKFTIGKLTGRSNYQETGCPTHIGTTITSIEANLGADQTKHYTYSLSLQGATLLLQAPKTGCAQHPREYVLSDLLHSWNQEFIGL